jgi:hypothetical protein
MDTVSQTGSYAGYASLLILVVGGIITACNRHRIRSTCCGAEASVSMESTTPPSERVGYDIKQKPEIKVEDGL